MSENDLKCDRCGKSVRIVLRDGWLCQSCATRTYGARDERAAIVAWLRDEETCRRVARGNLADFIERGDHLEGSR